MAKAVKVEMPTGQVIWAQVASGPSDVAVTDVIQKLDIKELSSAIHAVSESVWEAAKDLAPDQVSVEFGLALEIKSGKLTSVLAEVSGTASLRITMSWSSTSSGDSPTVRVPTGV